MEKEELKVLTSYIAAWSWQIITIILLISSVIMLLIALPNKSYIMAVVVFIVFIICQYMAIKRRKEVFKDE